MRCPNGTRKNKQGVCMPKVEKTVTPKPVPKLATPVKTKRCPNGTRKNKKGDCVPKDAKVMPKAITPKPVAKGKAPELEKVASRIQSFMNRTKHKRREMYLKTICSEAGLCIAFGIEALKIKDFFQKLFV